MLQGQFIYLLIALSGGPNAAQMAVDEAASVWTQYGMDAARRTLQHHGYFPFALRAVDHGMAPARLGMTHCGRAQTHGQKLCARLVARVVDQSPVHLRVEAVEGFRVAHAHVVLPGGETERLAVDPAGIFDLPHTLDGAWRLGVSVWGPRGPETGVFMGFGVDASRRDVCRGGGDLTGLVRAINGVRKDLGRTPLNFTLAPRLYADQRSRELAEGFGHSPRGLGRALGAQRSDHPHAAEVVAEDASLAAICRGWLMSPAHRAALLDGRRDQIAFVQRGHRLAALLWARVSPDRRVLPPNASVSDPRPL